MIIGCRCSGSSPDRFGRRWLVLAAGSGGIILSGFFSRSTISAVGNCSIDVHPDRKHVPWHGKNSQMMTLRQVEVIRAVMVTGTIGGAARLLNVSAPGISRLVKYTEKSLGFRFFQRQNGRYFPTPAAKSIFEQINGVYKKVDDLTEIISKIDRKSVV